MKLVRSLDQLPDRLRSGAVTVGNFDGVHRGHARIIERLLARAGQLGGPAIVFTFDPHPVRLLRPQFAPPPLTWTDRKADLLAELGVDTTIAYPTDERLLRFTADQFFEQIICGALDARAIVEGPNFFFGHNREGDVHRLAELCEQRAIDLEIVPPLVVADALVSSSRVRELIRGGHVREAAGMLTQPYRVRGMVTHGVGRGHKIGFPTANVDAVDTLMPAKGVYAGRAYFQQRRWPAAINIGPNPTFGEQAVKFEVHLIEFDGSLYGQPLEVDFLECLRQIQPFSGVDQLQQQLRRDVEAARRIAEAAAN